MLISSSIQFTLFLWSFFGQWYKNAVILRDLFVCVFALLPGEASLVWTGGETRAFPGLPRCPTLPGSRPGKLINARNFFCLVWGIHRHYSIHWSRGALCAIGEILREFATNQPKECPIIFKSFPPSLYFSSIDKFALAHLWFDRQDGFADAFIQSDLQ